MPMSPPTVGLSFGSFGDIVTVLQLAWELRAALDQSAGASTEIQAVVRDVDVFTRAMQDVQANVERRRTHLRSDVLNGLSAALSRCRETLRVIQQRIERARSQTTISGWQRYWGTATWSILGGKKELEALRTHLSDQVGTMQLYLSLSDANSQEHVQEEIAAHGTTLERMFTIVQDIQLRFDVGVPSFRFYDDDDNRYYLPLARTSLQRLREVHEDLWHGEQNLNAWLSDIFGITEDDFQVRSELPTQVTIALHGAVDYRFVVGLSTPCFFFREAAFGEWQVLVGANRRDSQGNLMALKSLLERPHTVRAHCNCPIPCATRYRDSFDDIVRRREAAKLYSEVVQLVFDNLQPGQSNPGWLRRLLMPFFDCTDPEPLRSIVLPALRLQRLTPDEMIDLISRATQPSPAPFRMAIRHSSPQEITFIHHGRPHIKLLVEHAPHLPEHGEAGKVRVPDWGYFDWDNMALRRKENIVSACGPLAATCNLES